VADLSPAQRQLAGALRALRRRSGMTIAELAQALGWTTKQVSRTELGQRQVSAAEVASWATATGAPEDAQAELEQLLSDADHELRTWWDVLARGGGVAGRQADVALYEAQSERISNFQLIVPGLLQTADYARRVFTLGHAAGQDEIEAALAARLRRQEILYDPARQFDYVLSEAALHLDLGGGGPVLRAQADRLISLDSLPNVSLAVLPFTAASPILPTSGFTIYERPGQPLVLLETRVGDVTFTGAREVEAYRAAFAGLRRVSAADEEAHALIREVMITGR
jgi:transcriptional regulator with XRE-family HTH domain